MAEHAHTTPTTNPPSVTSVTPRRTLFRMASAMALAVAGSAKGEGISPAPADEGASVTKIPSPDAALIALCAKFDALERQYQGSDFTHDDDTPEGAAADAERDAIIQQQGPLLQHICAVPFTTMDGAVAVARTLALYTDDFDGYLWVEDRNDYFDARLTQALVRGLALVGGAT